jgi:putative methionine-R-sulfoxide reductase with GAF domain
VLFRSISFDPRVVSILQRRYVELEKLAKEQPLRAPPKLSTDIKVERGLAPDAGFAESDQPLANALDPAQVSSNRMAAAQQEAQTLAEFSDKLGPALSLDDILSLLSVRIRRLVTYDAMAVYVLRDKVLYAEFVSGENFRLFSSLRIPVGEGLSGWVAQNAKPILNGNPSVEPGYLNDSSKFSTLRSALAVPLQGSASVVAVLALYRSVDSFSSDDLAVLLAVGSKMGSAVEHGLKDRGKGPTQTSALTARAGAS